MPNFWPQSRQDESYLTDSRPQDVRQSATETEQHLCCRESGHRLDIILRAGRHVCVTHGLDAARLHLETARLVCDVQLSKNDRSVTLVFKREEKIDFSYDRMEIRRQYIYLFSLLLTVPMCSMDLGNRVVGFATATATAAADFPSWSRHTAYRPVQAKFCLYPSQV